MSGIINSVGSKSGVIGGRRDRWKQYTGAISGADFALSSNIANLVVHRAIAIPYQTSDGAWRLKFNFRTTSDTSTSHAITMSGVTFKNVSAWYSSLAVFAYGGHPYTGSGQVDPGGSIIYVYATSTATIISVSGDVELNSKPTWAD